MFFSISAIIYATSSLPTLISPRTADGLTISEQNRKDLLSFRGRRRDGVTGGRIGNTGSQTSTGSDAMTESSSTGSDVTAGSSGTGSDITTGKVQPTSGTDNVAYNTSSGDGKVGDVAHTDGTHIIETTVVTEEEETTTSNNNTETAASFNTFNGKAVGSGQVAHKAILSTKPLNKAKFTALPGKTITSDGKTTVTNFVNSGDSNGNSNRGQSGKTVGSDGQSSAVLSNTNSGLGSASGMQRRTINTGSSGDRTVIRSNSGSGNGGSRVVYRDQPSTGNRGERVVYRDQQSTGNRGERVVYRDQASTGNRGERVVYRDQPSTGNKGERVVSRNQPTTGNPGERVIYRNQPSTDSQGERVVYRPQPQSGSRRSNAVYPPQGQSNMNTAMPNPVQGWNNNVPPPQVQQPRIIYQNQPTMQPPQQQGMRVIRQGNQNPTFQPPMPRMISPQPQWTPQPNIQYQNVNPPQIRQFPSSPQMTPQNQGGYNPGMNQMWTNPGMQRPVTTQFQNPASTVYQDSTGQMFTVPRQNMNQFTTPQYMPRPVTPQWQNQPQINPIQYQTAAPMTQTPMFNTMQPTNRPVATMVPSRSDDIQIRNQGDETQRTDDRSSSTLDRSDRTELLRLIDDRINDQISSNVLRQDDIGTTTRDNTRSRTIDNNELRTIDSTGSRAIDSTTPAVLDNTGSRRVDASSTGANRLADTVPGAFDNPNLRTVDNSDPIRAVDTGSIRNDNTGLRTINTRRQENTGLRKLDNTALRQDDANTRILENTGLRRQDNAGLDRPVNIGSRRQDNTVLDRPVNIGSRRQDNTGLDRPVNIGPRRQDNAGFDRPVNIGSRRQDNTGLDRPVNMGSRIRDTTNLRPVDRVRDKTQPRLINGKRKRADDIVYSAGDAKIIVQTNKGVQFNPDAQIDPNLRIPVRRRNGRLRRRRNRLNNNNNNNRVTSEVMPPISASNPDRVIEDPGWQTDPPQTTSPPVMRGDVTFNYPTTLPTTMSWTTDPPQLSSTTDATSSEESTDLPTTVDPFVTGETTTNGYSTMTPPYVTMIPRETSSQELTGTFGPTDPTTDFTIPWTYDTTTHMSSTVEYGFTTDSMPTTTDSDDSGENTDSPGVNPTFDPTIDPTVDPTAIAPTLDPSSPAATNQPLDPTVNPTLDPTLTPAIDPDTSSETDQPNIAPTISPTPGATDTGAPPSPTSATAGGKDSEESLEGGSEGRDGDSGSRDSDDSDMSESGDDDSSSEEDSDGDDDDSGSDNGSSDSDSSESGGGSDSGDDSGSSEDESSESAEAEGGDDSGEDSDESVGGSSEESASGDNHESDDSGDSDSDSDDSGDSKSGENDDSEDSGKDSDSSESSETDSESSDSDSESSDSDSAESGSDEDPENTGISGTTDTPPTTANVIGNNSWGKPKPRQPINGPNNNLNGYNFLNQLLQGDDDESNPSSNFWLGNQNNNAQNWWNDRFPNSGIQNNMPSPARTNVLGYSDDEDLVPLEESMALLDNIDRDMDEMYFNTKSWLHVIEQAGRINRMTMERLRTFDRIIDMTYNKLANMFFKMPNVNDVSRSHVPTNVPNGLNGVSDVPITGSNIPISGNDISMIGPNVSRDQIGGTVTPSGPSQDDYIENLKDTQGYQTTSSAYSSAEKK